MGSEGSLEVGFHGASTADDRRILRHEDGILGIERRDFRCVLRVERSHEFRIEFVERRNRFQNELIIAAHFSTRYHDKQVLHFVKKSLPDMLDGRLHLWL